MQVLDANFYRESGEQKGDPESNQSKKIDFKSEINDFKKSGGRNQQWERDNKFYNSHS